MSTKKLLLIVAVGFAIGAASLLSSAIAIGSLLIYGGIIGMISVGASDRLLNSLGRAIAWGCSTMLIASILVLLAKLAAEYCNELVWPITPENALGVIWGGGGLMMLLWLILGSLIRVLK
jgi:hypothetical protein